MQLAAYQVTRIEWAAPAL